MTRTTVPGGARVPTEGGADGEGSEAAGLAAGSAGRAIGTALLVALTFAVIDEYNAPVKSNLAPLALGLVVVVIGISFGANAGYAINPARDVLIARGAEPDPEISDEGRTAVDEPGGATR